MTEQPEKPPSEMTERELEERIEELQAQADLSAVSAANKIIYLGMLLRGEIEA